MMRGAFARHACNTYINPALTVMEPTPSACALIREEHRTLAALLHALKHLVREIRANRLKPDFTLLRAIVYYIDAYPERMHHPKEEAFLFGPLALRTHEVDPDLAILRAEHESGERLIRDLGHTLLRYEHEGQSGFALFAVSVESYATFYYQHMEREEKVIIPAALKKLAPADWEALNQAFEGNSDPLKGAGELHFRELFSQIVNLAPPPIGVGPPFPPRAAL